MRWLEAHSSEIYESVIEADRLSIKRFGGHGSAIAQVYNHMIMPLANPQEKRTQTYWGAEDFERRFGRYPEGMWLPETAVDIGTLEALAEAQIKFTILSPSQAFAIRGPGIEEWIDVSGGRINTRTAYSCNLPSGRTISLFFFDRALSTDIAFGDLLANGDVFARALMGGFSNSEQPQLVNVASDGETYGHHHKNGHAALTRCLSQIDGGNAASTTNYGFFLSLAPPTHEVKIIERTSWSCAHGVERWRSNCGCGSEIRRSYSQEWRTPLRLALDWLRDRLADVYIEEGPRVFVDPVAVRDQLLHVALDRRVEVNSYLGGLIKTGLPTGEQKKAPRLLEMLECSALMYASDAWFWEDISRMETVQTLRFAARGIDLARDVIGRDFDPDFKRLLLTARPNDLRFRTGAQLYERLARTAKSV
jgi:alpha-amylase/alpha-mannosidase (GH57 family)